MTKCICWNHSTDKSGYGTLNKKQFKTKLIHRLTYEKAYGKLIKGDVIMHTCDNPTCYNIHHLQKGTQLDNIKDRVSKGRCAKGDNNARTKISKEDARLIWQSKLSSRILAKQFNVSHTAILEAKRRNTKNSRESGE